MRSQCQFTVKRPAVPPKCALRLFELRRLSRHNLPFSVLPYPDICEAKFSAEWLAIFVFACPMVIPIGNYEVLAVHSHFEGRSNRAGVRVGRVLEESESGFLIENGTVWHDVGKVVRPNTFQVRHIFADADLTPRIVEFCNHFRDLFSFVNRYRRLRWASGNTSRQSCAHSNEYHQEYKLFHSNPMRTHCQFTVKRGKRRNIVTRGPICASAPIIPTGT